MSGRFDRANDASVRHGPSCYAFSFGFADTSATPVRLNRLATGSASVFAAVLPAGACPLRGNSLQWWFEPEARRGSSTLARRFSSVP